MSLAVSPTTGTLTQGWQGRRHESPTYYAGLAEKETKKQTRQGREKERKKAENPREGWEDGTPPPHRDFKERCVVR